MKACARGRYSNEFRHACVGKAHLIGMSLVSLMNNQSAGAMAYRLHHEASGARRADHALSRLRHPIVECMVSSA
jgi:hypothetical protein